MPRALLSASDKTGLIALGRGLAARGFELISTGGTARALADAGLAVTSVSAVTGVPEMMDGRVKTLHPRIHGGILARRHHPDDLAAAAAHGIGLIDVVVVNLYPFAKTAEKPGVRFDELVEQIDIGGPSLIRAAAKNFRDVLIVVDPGRYGDLLQELDRPDGPALALRFELAIDAFAHTAQYDAMICGTLAEFSWRDGAFARNPKAVHPEAYSFEIQKVRDLRYGENPHQPGSLWESRIHPLSLTFVQGKELSYTNLLDLEAAWRIAAEFDDPAAVIVKHTNPCGAATAASSADAYVRARDADALSAFGGIVGLNRPLDIDTARAITSTFVEAVIAPTVEDEAATVLASKDKMRVVTLAAEDVNSGSLEPLRSAKALSSGAGGGAPARKEHWWTKELRSVFDGFLIQERDRVSEARDAWPHDGFPKVVTKRQPTAEEWQALRFAWRICAHVKSNAVIFTDAQRTLAIGAGQMSRVDAVNVAVMKARAADRSLQGSAAASDAFFPFRDGLDALAGAGATAVVQPGGSVRDAEVIAAADEHGLAMVFAGRRHFRH